MEFLFIMCVAGIIMEVNHCIYYHTIRDLTYRNRLASKVVNAHIKVYFAILKYTARLIKYAKCDNERIRNTCCYLLHSSTPAFDNITTMPSYKRINDYLKNTLFTKEERRRLLLWNFIEFCYMVTIIGISLQLNKFGYRNSAWFVAITELVVLPCINTWNHQKKTDRIKLFYIYDIVTSIVIYVSIIMCCIVP